MKIFKIISILFLLLGILSAAQLVAQTSIDEVDQTEVKENKLEKEPDQIGYPLRDLYASESFKHYKEAKRLTALAQFININMVEIPDDGSGVTSEMQISTADGKALTTDNALEQLQHLQEELQVLEQNKERLNVLSEKSLKEKTQIKDKMKGLTQWKQTETIRMRATAEVGATLVALGKNITTLMKMSKN